MGSQVSQNIPTTTTGNAVLMQNSTANWVGGYCGTLMYCYPCNLSTMAVCRLEVLIGTWSASELFNTLIILSSKVCGGEHGEGTRKSPLPGSKRNTLSAIGETTGVSSGNDATTRGSPARLGCTTPKAPPSNDTSESKAKPTPTIRRMLRPVKLLDMIV
jgi:hypothetical protein